MRNTIIIYCLINILWIVNCNGNSFGIGMRQNGDHLLYTEKLQSSLSELRKEHQIIHKTTNLTLISYLLYLTNGPPKQTKILLINENQIEIILYGFNVTQLNVTVLAYGYTNSYLVPNDFVRIIYALPNDEHLRFGLGRRQLNDRHLLDVRKKSSSSSPSIINGKEQLSVKFEIDIKDFITYVNFSVNSKTAGYKYSSMSSHTLNVIVFDDIKHNNSKEQILMCNMSAYGYRNDDKVPKSYQSILIMKQIETVDDEPELVLMKNITAHNNENVNVVKNMQNEMRCKYVMEIIFIVFILVIT